MVKWMARMGAVLAMLAMAAVAASTPLSEAEVQRFIASLPEIEQLSAEEQDAGWLDEADGLDFERPLSGSIHALRGRAMYGQLDAVAAKHGFSGLEHWARVGDKVFKAFLALEMEQQRPQLQAQAAEQLREIEQNPHLTPEQREQLKHMLSSSMQFMESLAQAPASDMEAVRPHLAELRRLLER